MFCQAVAVTVGFCSWLLYSIVDCYCVSLVYPYIVIPGCTMMTTYTCYCLHYLFQLLFVLLFADCWQFFFVRANVLAHFLSCICTLIHLLRPLSCIIIVFQLTNVILLLKFNETQQAIRNIAQTPHKKRLLFQQQLSNMERRNIVGSTQESGETLLFVS